MIGQILDHYRIESKLGEGGMGVVYRARDTHLNRDIAAKILPPDRIADAGRRERFVREARAASALNHPSIVTIYDIRSVNGVDVIVMEYVEGQTLEQMIPAKGMSVTEALKIAVQIADGLARAHEAGILHRDIKPANVMVTAAGRAKILDFGLAKLTEPAGTSPDDATQPQLTEEGAIVGTAAYMSPEQCEGRKVDSRSDIFSFGALLYEMVTGRRPFPGQSRLATLTRIVNDDPLPPRQLNALVPADLEKAILRCLRKDPARRYQSMADLKVALEDLQTESLSAPRADAVPVRARSRPLWLIWAALITVTAAATFFALHALRAQRHTQPPQATALTTFPGIERYPSLSPDGNHVAFTWNGPKRDNADIYVQLIGSGSPLRLTTDPGSDLNPVWSPDGRWIAFLRGESAGPLAQSVRELRLIAPLGGPERKLAEIRVRQVTDFHPVYLNWCPDSTCLVVTDSSGEAKPDALFAISLETGEKKQITTPQNPVLGDVSPAISRDGRSLVFHRIVSHGFGELHILSLGEGLAATGQPRRLTTKDMYAEYPTWMPDNKQILFSAQGSLWRLAVFDNSPPEQIPFVGEDGLMPVVSRPRADQSVRLVYARSFTDENIWRIDTSAPGARSSSAPVQAIASTRFDIHPRISPDGRRVAFTSTRSGTWQIWISDPDGTNAVQLTSMRAYATGAPRWSRDGERIAFGSDQEGSFDLYVVPAAGGKPQRLTTDPAFDQGAFFSGDDKSIYFVSGRTGRFEIWRMTTTGADPVQVTTDGGWTAYEAPDAASIYYIDNPVEGATLWHLPFSEKKPARILAGIVWWNLDLIEKGLYYIDRDDAGEARLRFFDFATRKSTTTAVNLGNVRCCVSASADGRTIFYVREDSSVDDLVVVENFR